MSARPAWSASWCTGAPRSPRGTGTIPRTRPSRFVPIRAFRAKTLVFSGDRVYRDENDFIYFVARADDMIKTKGFRVSPTEVEMEVVRHPEIVDAVAFAVPNITVGEDVGCAYTTVDGKPLAEPVLKQFLKQQLPNHMVPAMLLHFDSFPFWAMPASSTARVIKSAHSSDWAWPVPARQPPP